MILFCYYIGCDVVSVRKFDWLASGLPTGAPRAVGRVLHLQNRMFLLEQMEWAQAWLV